MRGAKTSKTPGPSEVLRTKRGIMRRLTLYLPPDVARAFHARCIAEGTTMSAALEAWVADYSIGKGTARFVQIAVSDRVEDTSPNLFALDEAGRVYRYVFDSRSEDAVWTELSSARKIRKT